MPSEQKTRPSVWIIGGPDVDARLEFMDTLKDDYHFSVVGSDPALQHKFSQTDYPFYEYPLSRTVNPLADVWSLYKLYRLFKQHKPDIIHTFDTKPNIWGRLAGHLAGVKCIVGTITGLGALYTNDRLRSKVLRTMYEVLQRAASKRSTTTIFQNDDDRSHYQEHNITSREKSYLILGSGVDTKRYDRSLLSQEDLDQLRESLGIPPDHVVITMVSRLIRTKGVMEFHEISEQVTRTQPNTLFLLVGGRDEGGVDALSEDELEALQRSVRWIGQRSDIPEILGMTDIFFLPSLYREGIPRVLLEAASMGLPLITTDAPGCREVARNEENGYLVDLNDQQGIVQKMVSLSQNPEKRAAFGEKSRELAVSLFDLQLISQQIDAVYKDCLLKSA